MIGGVSLSEGIRLYVAASSLAQLQLQVTPGASMLSCKSLRAPACSVDNKLQVVRVIKLVIDLASFKIGFMQTDKGDVSVTITHASTLNAGCQ